MTICARYGGNAALGDDLGMAEQTHAVAADLISALDYAVARLMGRLDGLDDAEWAWTPTADDRIGLRWRLQHIADVLSMERNWTWLGLPPPVEPLPPTPTLRYLPPAAGQPGGAAHLSGEDLDGRDAAAAVAHIDEAHRRWRASLESCDDAQLAAPIGPLAAPYYDQASRRAFVLHVADELIHHGAEAALLRDLYAARPAG